MGWERFFFVVVVVVVVAADVGVVDAAFFIFCLI